MNCKTSHKGHRKVITEEHTRLFVESLNLQLALNPIKEEVILLDEFSFSPKSRYLKGFTAKGKPAYISSNYKDLSFTEN